MFNRHPIIALLSIAILVALGVWKYYEPARLAQERDKQLLLTSDAGAVDRTVTVWGDDWLGYMIFKSRAMQEALRKHRIGIRYVQVPDFRERVRGIAEGKCDFIAITADSYIANGKEFDYPGVILFLIDESFGGDAIIGGHSVPNLDALNSDKLKGALVGNSPSEFLLKSSMAHFRLEKLQPRIKSFRRDKAEDAYADLASGKADFAVLWEPFASRALRDIPGTRRLLDTSHARGLVLDVTVASRSVMLREPVVADHVTRAYFTALHYYLNNPNEMRALAEAYSGQPAATVDPMLAGVRFISLDENRGDWFGIASTGAARITESMQAIADILVRAGDFPADPIAANPYSLLNSRVLAGMVTVPGLEQVRLSRQQAHFATLSESEWKALPVTGTLLDDPINFSTGQADLDEDSQALLREAARRLVYYPAQRVMVTAQVSPGSDGEQDRLLSQARADAVRTFLINTGVHASRVFADGRGSTGLPERLPGESDAAWKRRCRHARIYLLEPEAKSGGSSITVNALHRDGEAKP